MIVAVMQPYFVPYAGYFRLFTAADLFVLYDCVQFPRRGWVHRNQLPDALGRAQWLTLPLARADREERIRDLAFAPDAEARFRAELRRFPAVLDETRPRSEADHELLRSLTAFDVPPVTYLERQLRAARAALGLAPRPIFRSSSLNLPPELRGQDRILAIVRAVGGKTYVNAPGGRALYDEAEFRRHEIELRFLSDYQGPTWSILQRLLTEDRHQLADEVRRQS